MRNVLFYGGLNLGIALIFAGLMYRIVEGNPGGPPQDIDADRRTVRNATAMIFAGGLIAIGGPFAAYWLSRPRDDDDSGA